VPRQVRTDVTVLLQEARAIEMLANEVDVPIERTERYWGISAELITVVAEIENFAAENPEAVIDDPEMLVLRRRLRRIGSDLAELSIE